MQKGGREGRLLRVLPLAIALLCHGVALLHFVDISPSLRVPAHWQVEFKILLTLSCCITTILFFVRKPHALIWLLLLQNLVCLLLILPEGNVLSLSFSLLALLIIQSTIYLSTISGLCLACVSLAVWFIGQQGTTAWFQPVPGAPVVDQIVFASFAVSLIAVSVLVRFYNERCRRAAALNRRLDGTILQLTSANVGFQRYATSVEERSMREERDKVTQEIHDTVGYAMTNLTMMLEEAIDLAPAEDGKLRTLLEVAQDQARTALNVTRYSLRSLRSIEMEEVEGLRRIQRLVKAFQEATRVSVTVDYGNVPWSFGEEYDTVVFGIIQEGITNAFRHGKASRISIKLWLIEDDTIQLVVHDNGKGAENITEGIGIAGMRERVANFHGRLDVRNAVDGFEILAWIPWAKESDDDETGESTAG